ncbi:hypothetical protein SEMRO_192_G082521.1 [Seminavis robusta]|uniref:Uncharacterized protein n=1 Tax=Seminavis robusta TaxID=568900 RepID=A0A9N8DKJ1_9STRA|nr:hypothetical protein SEMRO_192_G082521.1 [Seminavis robusta]|eukprot:Sro192_g082521.1  (203) ;mRNA; f:58078-58686
MFVSSQHPSIEAGCRSARPLINRQGGDLVDKRNLYHGDHNMSSKAETEGSIMQLTQALGLHVNHDLAGMGGVYFDSEETPYLWRYPFPPDVQAQLVSTDNPKGNVTNSDLEQAAIFAQHVTYATRYTLSDNTPSVSRISKGAVTSDGPVVFLCTYACRHQREHRSCALSSYFLWHQFDRVRINDHIIAGKGNVGVRNSKILM